MASIKKRDTKPEMIVRRALHASGLRFRIHRRDLPGTPDIILPGRRLIVLVNGCFWHQHPGCRLARTPKQNGSYWVQKLARNVARDATDQAALAALGWKVMVVWECEAKDEKRLQQLIKTITEIGS